LTSSPRVEVWAVKPQPQLAYVYEGHAQVGDWDPWTRSLSWSPKANLLASVCTNGSVAVWPFG
jgi:hypothetical protein